MARTKLTAKKKEEITEPIAITDPTELEIVTDEDEYDNMDTTEQDKNEEACLIRTRLEEKLKETITQYMEIMDGKSKIPVRRDNMAERDEMTNLILNRTQVPNLKNGVNRRFETIKLSKTM
ncbi:hypothetical protein NPIL_253581 [Nephila pilipes]|uniref:Uncharacterized protein n=1 Tax=Nephila pilipes TaxID=299642 RepID=A0A8X6P9J5_NEPPI|nr:hypothetical protein NPIL_253581 [Nephila pilipes]